MSQTTAVKQEPHGNAVLAARRTVSYVLLVFLTVICIFPLYCLFINASRDHFSIGKGFSMIPGGLLRVNFNNVRLDHTVPILDGLKNSLFVAAITAVLTTYFSALTAYAIHAYDFKGKKFFHYFILMVMMIPAQVSALGFIDLMRVFDDTIIKFFHLLTDPVNNAILHFLPESASSWGYFDWALHYKMMESFTPLIIPSIAAPVVYFFMLQYMESALPHAIIEASRIDGAGEFFTFNKIVVPILKPAIAVQAIFAFVGSWNNYFTPSLILANASQDKKTLPIMVATLRGADFIKFDMGKVYMMIALSILPVVVIYLFLSKYIVQGVALGSVKG